MNSHEPSGTSIPKKAFGHLGIEPRWTSGRKKAVGTAYSSSSKIWYTISHGIINELYYPIIDHPQTRDLQLLITDGATFMHEERRHLKGDIRCVEGGVLGYCLRSQAPNGLYSVHKDIISTPHGSYLLIKAKIEGPPEILEKLKVYALLTPHLEIGGAGNSAQKLSASLPWGETGGDEDLGGYHLVWTRDMVNLEAGAPDQRSKAGNDSAYPKPQGLHFALDLG